MTYDLLKLASPFLSLALLSAGCGLQVEPDIEKHWGYEDSEETVGPEGWGTLAGDALCAAGQSQTPIALATKGEGAALPADLPNMIFAYQPSRLSLLNNGHTIQAAYDSGSTMSMSGDPLKLAQFHFHAPSEHTLDGQHFPMEMHLVHLNAEGKPAAVVGVFIKAGAENRALAQAFLELPQEKDQKVEPAGQTLDAAQLLPASKVFLSYAGSLTTPPCTEGLSWRVMKDPIELSQAQIDAFTSIAEFGHTNRPIQPLNGRTVQIDATP